MAKKPIELCLELTGDEATRFQQYLDNPTDTREGRELSAQALELARKTRLEDL
jgi:hypothetical protein